MTHLAMATALALLSLSCTKSGGRKAAEAAESTDSKAEKPSSAAVPTDAAPSPSSQPSVAELPELDLPELSTTNAKPKIARQARELHKKALALHRKASYAEAEKLYREVLAIDSAHLLARYNLACVYSMSGQGDKGLAILRQFKDAAECVACQGRLVRAREDKEWESLWKDPRFKALTASVDIARPEVDASTKLVIEALSSGRADGIAHLVHPQAKVRWVYVGTFCDDDSDCSSVEVMRGFNEVKRTLRAAKKSRTGEEELYEDDEVYDPLSTYYDELVCGPLCCELEVEERDASHTRVDLEKVCFEVDSGGVFHLAEITTSGD